MIGTRVTRSLLASLVLATVLLPTFPVEAEDLALLPLKQRARNAEAAAAVEIALELQLTAFGEVARGEVARSALRRLRLRDPEIASPDVLRELATELGAAWLVAATLHDVSTHPVPDLAVSMRLYDGTSGQLVWAGFQGRSGLDGRSVLGLGVLTSLDAVSAELVRRLLEEAPIGGDPNARTPRRSDPVSHSELGKLAIVPFTSYVAQDALAVAEAATEAVRAVLFRAGAELASASCVHESLRRQRAQAWGELAVDTREYLASTCGASHLLTGSVEHWDRAGSGLEPEPEIALSVRLLDAQTGQIQWMDSREAAGWDRGSFFGLRRVFSRGVLLDKLLADLIKTLGRLDLAVATPGPRG